MVHDEDKTRDQLIEDLVALRKQVAAMEIEAARQSQTDAWKQICVSIVEHAAEALRISEERNRALLDAIPDVTFRVRIDGTYLDYNSSRADNLVMPASAFLGKTVYEVLPELAPMAMYYLHRALETGEVQIFEHQLTVAGEQRDYEARIAACGPDEVLSIIRDVTEQKQAERHLQEAVADKERLLRELHHRVKNNLQIISSLLDLQSHVTSDNRTLELLRDSQRRIRAIAFIHGSLYQSNNLRQVEFAAYVQDLVLYLFQSHQQDATRIVPRLHIASLALDVEWSLPCGLIINELVSNALQHAFPEGRSGEIRVELYTEANNLTLTIQDNGIGIPEHRNFETSDMLGLQLVRLLTRQLHGTIQIDQTAGTAITIVFPYT